MALTPLEVLLAKDACADAALRYCRGIDRCDADLVKSAYHEGAYDDHGTFKGDAWQFAEFATTALRARYLATMHAIMNHLIEVDAEAGTAKGEIYCQAFHLREDDGKKTVDWWWGRYLDQYTQRDGEWRISHRVCVHEWTMELPIDKAMPIAAELFTNGSFDRK